MSQIRTMPVLRDIVTHTTLFFFIFRDLSKCDFSEINEYFKKLSEERKNRSKEEKKAEKEKNDAIVEEYGFCTMDGHKEKIGNFR